MKARCIKHRRKAIYKWRICSIYGSEDKWEGICKQCDLDLNMIALKWRYPKSWKRRFEKYKARVA